MKPLSLPDDAVRLPPQIAAFYRSVIANAEATMLRDGQLPFTVRLLDANNVVVAVVLEWPPDSEGRDDAANVLRSLGVKHNAIALVIQAAPWPI